MPRQHTPGKLYDLPTDSLVIGPQMVRHDPNDEAIVRSIIALGHQFNLSVIAEGIERQEQLDYLRALGCDEMQGYLYARPLAESEFVEFVRERYCNKTHDNGQGGGDGTHDTAGR